MKSSITYSLCLVTDRELMSTETLEEAVEQAVRGGCSMVQLREKKLCAGAFYETALRVKKITRKYKVPLIINDRVDIALAADADGVHIGQSDLPAKAVRKLMGGKLVGVSVSNKLEAVRAVKDGADYLGVGAMYPTDTKTGVTLVSMEELARIRAAVDIPIIVIGGVNQKTAANFAGSGIDGFAVVSAVIARKDIAAASRELVDCFVNLGKG